MKPSTRPSRSEQLSELLAADLAVAEDLAQQARPDGLTAVNRHDRDPIVGMSEEVVAATDAEHLEAALALCGDHSLAGDPRQPLAHATRSR